MDYCGEVKKFLKEKANEKAKQSWQKFVPTASKVHGVYLADINQIVTRYKAGGLDLVEKLWQSGYLEERILAVKILGKIARQDLKASWRLLTKFIKDIDNWAVGDTLATQGVRPFIKEKQEEILALAERLIMSPRLWERRFALVLLINFKKDKSLKKRIWLIVQEGENEKEPYIKKQWLGQRGAGGESVKSVKRT